MYGQTGRMTAIPGRGRDLAEILLRAADTVAGLDGAIHYIVGIKDDDVVITEVWRSQSDHAASLLSGDVRSLIGEAMPLIAGFGDGSSYEVLGGLGLAGDSA